MTGWLKPNARLLGHPCKNSGCAAGWQGERRAGPCCGRDASAMQGAQRAWRAGGGAAGPSAGALVAEHVARPSPAAAHSRGAMTIKEEEVRAINLIEASPWPPAPLLGGLPVCWQRLGCSGAAPAARAAQKLTSRVPRASSPARAPGAARGGGRGGARGAGPGGRAHMVRAVGWASRRGGAVPPRAVERSAGTHALPIPTPCRSEGRIRAYFKAGGAAPEPEAAPAAAADAGVAAAAEQLAAATLAPAPSSAEVAARFPPPDADTFARWFPGLPLSRTACDKPRWVLLPVSQCSHLLVHACGEQRARPVHTLLRAPSPRCAGCACCASPMPAALRTCTPQKGRGPAARPRPCWCEEGEARQGLRPCGRGCAVPARLPG